MQDSPASCEANYSVACDRLTAFGVLWEKHCRLPIQWTAKAKSIFESLGLPVPDSLRKLSSESLVVEENQGLNLNHAETHLTTSGTFEQDGGRTNKLEERHCTDVTILHYASGRAEQSANSEDHIPVTTGKNQKRIDEESANEETAAEAAPESHKNKIQTRWEEEQPAAAPPDTTGFVSLHDIPVRCSYSLLSRYTDANEAIE